MNILYISPVKITANQGDSTHFLELGKNLQQGGNSVLVICRGEKRSHRNLNVKFVPKVAIRYLDTLITDFFLALYLIYYLFVFKPDAVYYRGVVLGGIISRLLRFPSIAEANGIYPDEVERERPLIFKFAGSFFKLKERMIYSFANRIICVTEGIKRELVMNYGVKDEICRVIHNGVNINLFRPLSKAARRKRLGIKKEYFYMGFVGSFKAWQGLETLIEAMKIVKDKGYNKIKCFFIGDGNLMNKLKEMVSQYSLQKEIIFKGRVIHQNIPAYINSFDICYLSKIGLRFGFSPLKLYEYLACARPVIASRVEGISEVVEAGNCGYLFDPDDVTSLVSSIIESYNARDKLSELGRNGRRFVEDKFSWQQVADKVQSVLKEAVGQK